MALTPAPLSFRDTLSLTGEWTFALDPQDIGIRSAWYSRDLDSHVELPGSWAEQGLGDVPDSHFLAGWNATHDYEGAAWYTRSLDVPAEWQNHAVVLVLKGVRWQSQVWLDGTLIGQNQSLSVPHHYDLTPYLKPAMRQRLAIQIDNRMIYPLNESHINSEQTATRWGGITGGVELVISPQIAIKSVKCRPDIPAKAFHFEVMLDSAPDLTLEAVVTDPISGTSFTSQTVAEDGIASCSVALGEDARLWSDEDPFLYQAVFILKQGDTAIDALEKSLGLREITIQGQQIRLNGVPVFLRGYVDCCIFPQTGYPVWDIDHYRHQFRIARSYGFNHVRLHSWTPPEPFWQAADELGMLVQTELPNWSEFYRADDSEPPSDVHHFLMRELEQSVEVLNLHPSWVMFSNGNELISPEGHHRLIELIARGRELDPTRLFTDNTGFGQIPAPNRTVDYFIQSCNWHPPKKIYDAASNDTTEDFSAITALSDRPVIGHEHGQFTMYVRPSEAQKYTGALRPSWLESIEETFAAKHISPERVEEYIQASGTHMVRTYKENIERARRTRGLAGLQLLDIRDFPGQGHATTGILDMFWDSKGLVEPETFSEFNGAVVLLMRAASPTFWNGASIEVDLEVSHFGREPLAEGTLTWELVALDDTTRLSGQITFPVVPTGGVTPLGHLIIATPSDSQPRAWELVVRVGAFSNHWHIWTFPYPEGDASSDVGSRILELRSALPKADFSDNFGGTFLRIDVKSRETMNPALKLALSDRLSLRLLQYLQDGGTVWLMPDATQIYDQVRTRYLPPFWSYLHFPDNVSSVMGMIIREHPALADFPHDGYSDWQWYDLVNDTSAICLDSVPLIEPIVEVIDNFNRAKRLAYAFEARVGAGKLFVSTWKLSDPNVAGRPEVRFLLNKVLQYLKNTAFSPTQKLSVGQLLGLFKLTNIRASNLE